MDLWHLLIGYPDHTNLLLYKKANAQFRKELEKATTRLSLSLSQL